MKLIFLKSLVRLFRLRSRLVFVLSFLLLLISCNTLSPVVEGSGQAELFSTVENVDPEWLTFAEGIGYFHGKIKSPKIEFYTLKIDLESPNVRLVVRGGDHYFGCEIPDNGALNEISRGTLSTRVTSFVRDNNLIAGVNALPFDIVSAKERQPIKNIGVVISEGELISPANSQYDAIIFNKNENTGHTHAAIVKQSGIRQPENYQNAVGGFHQILADSELTLRVHTTTARHPRSAAGISPNRQYLYLLVIDGRRLGSIGATERETALLLRSIGCHDAINFDGGGSSALALRYPDGRVRAVNTPIHNNIPGMERAVAGCLGVSPSTEK